MRPAIRSTIVRVGTLVAVPIVAFAYVLALLPLPGGWVGDPIPSFASTNPVIAAIDLAAGLGLILAGILAWLGEPRSWVGALAVLAGMAWFGQDLVTVGGRVAGARTVGQLFEPFLVPLVVDLALRLAPGDRRRSRRLLIAVLYVAAAIVALIRVVSYDPFFDPNCLAAVCEHVRPLVTLGPDGRGLLRLTRPALSMVAALWLIVAASRGLAHPGWHPRGRKVMLMGGLIVGLAATARSAMQLRTSAVDPREPVQVVVYVALALGSTLVGVGLAWSIVEARRTTLRVRRIAHDIGSAPAPGSFQTSLSAALEDPSLSVDYWLTAERRYVDAEGSPRPVAQTAPGRAETQILRHGQPVAVVRHAEAVGGSAITAAIGPAMLVALDNERLHATRRAQLRDLRASRARIVDVGDAERRRIERDLHDGAQQRLLTISFDLRLARQAAERAGDAARSARLAGLEELARSAMQEVRTVAHGIHPAVLSQAGLAFALASLAEDATIPIDVSTELRDRPAESVETAAYQVVTEALGEAVRRGAGSLRIRVVEVHGRIVVETWDDAEGRPDLPIRVIDRVGASGGDIVAEAVTGGRGGRIRAELPCA